MKMWDKMHVGDSVKRGPEDDKTYKITHIFNNGGVVHICMI